MREGRFLLCNSKVTLRYLNPLSYFLSFRTLLILDIKMPRLNGFDVLAALKEDPRTKDIPVIILTSSKEKTDLLQAYNLGAERYIVKPIAYDEYVTTIAEIGDYWKRMQTPLKHKRLKKVPIV
jgi:CheY-like chemotaxis protein